ncbi:hypothetical protein JY651_11100 [Pyxidicoccus parkwayensis]|uniref:Uncharacterized protein n=1 Tax=Pyxidicoccus parkwayensis TaxID=2813578 RepID=A0ABX7P4L8_9BACT|nr:hypothetical protein [Pyxidicoccus parkwaysis]QSQ25432.1 hypothetical protein JY651_11100 [Pyxidicoccus parkwaysis]
MKLIKYVALDGIESAPTWNAVRRAIELLERGQSRALSMGEDETGDVFMIISRCQPSGLYVSARAIEEADDYDLVDTSAPSDLLECVVGAQRQTVTSDAIVDAAQVEPVARHFLLTGMRLDSARWRKTQERYTRMAQGEPVHRRP